MPVKYHGKWYSAPEYNESLIERAIEIENQIKRYQQDLSRYRNQLALKREVLAKARREHWPTEKQWENSVKWWENLVNRKENEIKSLEAKVQDLLRRAGVIKSIPVRRGEGIVRIPEYGHPELMPQPEVKKVSSGATWAVFPSRKDYEYFLKQGAISPNTPTLITGDRETTKKIADILSKQYIPQEKVREIFAKVRGALQKVKTPSEKRKAMVETVKSEVPKVTPSVSSAPTIRALTPIIGVVLSIAGVFMLIKVVRSIAARVGV